MEAPCPWQCFRAVFNPPKPALNLAGCCHLRPRCKHTSAHNMKTWKPSFARVQTPEGLCVEAVFFSPFQPLFRSPQTWMRQIAAVASRHCCNFTDAVTCPGRSTKLFAFQCRKHSPVSQLRNSTQHSRANAPPSPCRQCCLE